MKLRHALFTSASAAALLMAGSAGASTVSLLNNGSFENTFWNGTYLSELRTGGFTSAMFGNWALGDAARSIVSAGALDGQRILSFPAVPFGNVSADVYQIVDLTAYASEIDTGLATVDTSAWVLADARLGFGMVLAAWKVAPTAFSGYTLLQDGYDFTTGARMWKEVGYQGVALAKGTRYLAFGLNSPAGAETRTFVDSASLLLHTPDVATGVAEPGTLALAAAGLLGAAAVARRSARRPG